MDLFKFTFRESVVALLACIAVVLFCSEADNWVAFAISKGVAVVLGFAAWLISRTIKTNDDNC